VFFSAAILCDLRILARCRAVMNVPVRMPHPMTVARHLRRTVGISRIALGKWPNQAILDTSHKLPFRDLFAIQFGHLCVSSFCSVLPDLNPLFRVEAAGLQPHGWRGNGK
jgi:hypothetical protein